MVMKPSPTIIKIGTFPACEQTLHFRDVEGSHARETRERRREKGAALAGSLAARLRLPLRNRELARGYKIS